MLNILSMLNIHVLSTYLKFSQRFFSGDGGKKQESFLTKSRTFEEKI